MEAQEKHRKAIEDCLSRIRQYLVNDGGDCELVDVSEDGKTVYVRLKGACSHCAGAIWTLKLGIEQALKEEVPGVESVVPVP
jgi:Fe-S cluster biogenesis protein NfuA